MNRLIARPVLMLAVSALAFGVVAAPVKVSAAEIADLDEDTAAAQLCPAGATFYDADGTDDGDRATVDVYSYESEGVGDDPGTLCTFAIISTEDGSTLDGSYALSVGARSVSGAVPAGGGASAAVISPVGQSPSAVYAASGRQVTVAVTKVSTAKRKKAKKALAASRKKAQKAYAKAGRSSAAKKVMKRRLAAASKKYAKAVASRTSTTRLPYRLDLTLPLDVVDDLP